MSERDARGEAEQALQQVSRTDLMSLFSNARTGVQSGIRQVLDMIAQYFIIRATQNYIEQVFSNYVRKEDYEDRVTIITEFLQRYGPLIGSDIDLKHPQRYANDLEKLITDVVNAINERAKDYRRL